MIQQNLSIHPRKNNLKGVLLLFTLFFGLTSHAQWTSGKYMKQAITRTLTYAKTYETNSSVYGFAKGLSFLGTFLEASGGKSSFTVELKAEKSYIIMGGGDDDATDVDLKISQDGTTLASDTKTDNEPFVKFYPPKTGTYSITLSNYATKSSYCCLVILESGGIALNTTRIDEAKNALFGTSSIINQASTGVVFQSQTNSWCIFGYLVEQGVESKIIGIPLRTDAKHYVVAVGDHTLSDIDLCVTNSANSDEICNQEMDATPLGIIKKATASTYGFKVKNIKSEGRGFVLVSILRE